MDAVDNILYSCPGNTHESYAENGRAIASFYAELLEMMFLREDSFLIAPGQGGRSSAGLR